MKREIRNPKSHRQSAVNEARTQKVIETYYGKAALLTTWEAEPNEIQIANSDYLSGLRKTVRTLKGLLLHRADAKVKI